MEALFAQFSFLANQALDDKNFDPRNLDELLLLFEQEAYSSWSAADADHHDAARDAEASMREAEAYLDSLMDAAMDEFRRSCEETERASKKELSTLVRAADAVEKMGHSIGAAAGGAAKKYMDAAMTSAVATMKSGGHRRVFSLVGSRGAEMGVEKQILKAGNGPKPVRGQTVTVHCTGFGKNGDLSQKFWSTKDPGQQPFAFKIGMGSVIKGWDEGVMGMQLGEIAHLQCSPDYGYGAGGFPAWGIKPNSVLVFEIEVLSIQ